MKISTAIIAAAIATVIGMTIATYATNLNVPSDSSYAMTADTNSPNPTPAAVPANSDCTKIWVHRTDDPSGKFVWIQVWGDGVTSAALASCNQLGHHVDQIADMPVTLNGKDIVIPRLAVMMNGKDGGIFFVPKELAPKVARLVTNETDDGLGIYEGWLDDAVAAPDGNADYVLQKVQ